MAEHRRCPDSSAVNLSIKDILKRCNLHFMEMTRKSGRPVKSRYLITAGVIGSYQASEKPPPGLPVAGEPPPSPCSILDLPPPAPSKASDLSPPALKEMAVDQTLPRASKGVRHNSLFYLKIKGILHFPPANCMPDVFFTDQLKIGEDEEELVYADEKVLYLLI